MYMNEDEGDENEIDCPTKESGLFIIKADTKEIVRVSIPRNALAFQIGQTLQIISGGILLATKHAVMGVPPSHPAARTSSRSTFAVFLEPNWDAPMTTPAGREDLTGVKQFRPNTTFGQFSKDTTSLYY